MPAKLETLPWLVLSRICEYLDDDDDDDDTYASNQRRSNLRAFSLTSRQCCAATASLRFCQVRAAVTNADDLIRILERWADMLDRDGGRYRYLQKLKVISPGQDKVDDDWEEHRYAPWLSDVPRFCRPSSSSTEHSPRKLESTTGDPWLALARFIGQLPALKDLVWGFCNMPQPILAVIHAAGTCRLHMHHFHLGSLVLHRNGYPQVIDIDPDDYALATSPALYSVVAEVCSYETGGELNYNEDAILGMAAGAAPNLQHVWLIGTLPGDSLPLRAAVALGKPPAPSDNLFSLNVQAGSLQSLLFTASSRRYIKAWAARANLSKLCCLASAWDPALVDIAARSELPSLRGLFLKDLKIDNARAAGQLLTALNPNSLRSLYLDGYIDDACSTLYWTDMANRYAIFLCTRIRITTTTKMRITPLHVLSF